MTTDRVYRGGLSHFRALAELDRCSGTQFDPDVVEAFKAEFAVTGGLEPSLLETA
jgi:HD-GYP domain-containing protein (c-di-GMP phosphodiesterase class II)